MGACIHQVNPRQVNGSWPRCGGALLGALSLGVGALDGGLSPWRFCRSCVRTPSGCFGMKPRAAARPGTRSTPGKRMGPYSHQVNPRQANGALQPPGQPQGSEWGLPGARYTPGKPMGPWRHQVNPLQVYGALQPPGQPQVSEWGLQPPGQPQVTEWGLAATSSTPLT